MSILPTYNARLTRIARGPSGGNPVDQYNSGGAGATPETTVWQGDADCWIRRKMVRSSKQNQENIYSETHIDIPATLGYVDVGTILTVLQEGRTLSFRVQAVTDVGVGLDAHPYYAIIAERE